MEELKTKFDYNETINEIKNIMLNLYNFHSLEMAMYDSDYVDHVSILINTTAESVNDIDEEIVNKLKEFVNRYAFQMSLLIVERIKVLDLENYTEEELKSVRPYEEIEGLEFDELNELEQEIVKSEPDGIMISNTENLEKIFAEQYFE